MGEKYNWNSSLSIFLQGGGLLIILCAFGAFIHRWFVFNNLTIDDYIQISIPISIGIAIYAVGLAFSATDRMHSLSNYFAQDIKGIFEDRRLFLKDLRENLEEMNRLNQTRTVEYRLRFNEYNRQFIYSIWKGLTYLRQSTELIRWVDKKIQNQLINLLMNYYVEIFVGVEVFNIQISQEYKNQLTQMYEIIKEFKTFDEEGDKKEFIESLLWHNISF